MISVKALTLIAFIIIFNAFKYLALGVINDRLKKK